MVNNTGVPKITIKNVFKVDLSNEKQIEFRKLVEVVGKSNEIKNTNESHIQQPFVDKNGRRLGVLPHKKQFHPNAE